MTARERIVPATALAIMAVAACSVFRSEPDGVHTESIDFTKAVTAEVRNAQGQVVLSGPFVETSDDNETERSATLSPTGVDADASGEAEVEVSGSGGERRQEVEFSVVNVEPKSVVTFVIDGRTFVTATADDRGRASAERLVPLPVTGR
jgi:hypothetical protein